MDQSSPEAAVELGRLIVACARRDHAAFRQLYDAQSSRLYGLALRMTRDAALAADILHEAMLQAWHRADRFDATLGSAEGWLTGLVRYRAIDLLRKYGREQTGHDGSDEPADEDPDPLQRLLSSDDGARLQACLATLDGKQRHAVTLSFWEGLSHAELAERLASPLGTVKSWIRRGLLGLKECLAR